MSQEFLMLASYFLVMMGVFLGIIHLTINLADFGYSSPNPQLLQALGTARFLLGRHKFLNGIDKQILPQVMAAH
jgi:hypothetical protein